MTRSHRRILAAVFPAVALVAFALLGAVPALPAQSPSPPPAPDCTLINQDGARVSLHQFRGRLVILTFIYTHCPDICPLTTAKLVRVQNELKKRGWLGEKGGQRPPRPRPAAGKTGTDRSRPADAGDRPAGPHPRLLQSRLRPAGRRPRPDPPARSLMALPADLP